MDENQNENDVQMNNQSEPVTQESGMPEQNQNSDVVSEGLSQKQSLDESYKVDDSTGGQISWYKRLIDTILSFFKRNNK